MPPSTPPVGETPPRFNPQATLLVIFLWLTFACVLPLHQVREDRRLARQELMRAVAENKLSKAGIIAAFDGANDFVSIAATGPCLMLAFTVIFLAHQVIRTRRRHGLLERRLRVYEGDENRPYQSSQR